MKLHTFTVKLADLMSCIFHALELISPLFARHHNQVAYISQRICESMGLNEKETLDIALAASLHDIGAISLEQSIDDLRFETEYIHEHSIVGALFLEHFQPLAHLAPLIRYHHIHYTHWQPATWHPGGKIQVPMGSYIIYLADRVSVMLNEGRDVLPQQKKIVDYVRGKRGKAFHPGCVDALLDIMGPEYFLLDTISQSSRDVTARLFRGKTMELDEKTVLSWTRFLSRIVDFRSPINAKHSSGVAASASVLAGLAGFSERECHLMLMAGYLHDLGKLSVPTAILEKKGPLNAHERAIINGHTYYTYRILKYVKEFDTLARWAAFHHERLDGSGCPFRIPGSSLPLGSQIMAVADIFSALNEERSYRPAMEKNKILDIMYEMVRDRAINGDLVRLLEKNYNQVEKTMQISQDNSVKEYMAMNPFLK